jgi:uncharacterized protein (DUF2147 family)
MKRFGFLAMLMVLSSSAHAGDSYSFVFGGHRIHVEAPRHCRSLSCVAVYETRRSRGRYDDLDAVPEAPPAKPLAAVPAQPQASAPAQVQALARVPVQVAAPPAMPPVGKPSLQPVACASAQPVIQPSEIQTPTPPAAAPVEKPLAAAQPAAVAAPPVLKISRDSGDEPVQTPLGDWRTAGNKGSVRIEQCGRALCGYILNTSTNAVGETVLINMKPKAALQWSGNIFSRDSGNAYYATMTMKGPNSLRVEACALGRFFCTGNVWSRVGAEPERLITSQRISSAPRS